MNIVIGKLAVVDASTGTLVNSRYILATWDDTIIINNQTRNDITKNTGCVSTKNDVINTATIDKKKNVTRIESSDAFILFTPALKLFDPSPGIATANGSTRESNTNNKNKDPAPTMNMNVSINTKSSILPLINNSLITRIKEFFCHCEKNHY